MAINNQPTIKARTVTGLFTKYIPKVIPLAFDESMSYYECLCALLDYINKNVIPALDNNAEGLEELQEFYVELQSYVNNYFDNLDVQEEINNKLDAMVESGELQEIIASYLNSKAIFAFDNVEDMKNAENLIDGSYARTLGYHEINDNGNALYLIRKITNQDVIDNGSIIAMTNQELIAELIVNDNINVKQFGAYGDNEHNDTTSIQKAFDYANKIKSSIYIPNGTYLISSINGYKNMKIKGQSKKETILKSINNNAITTGLLCFVNDNVNYLQIEDFTINGNKSNNTNEFCGLYLYTDGYKYGDCYSVIKNLEITQCSGNGIELIGRGIVEGRFINIRSSWNNKNGFYINGPTDSMFDKLTACFNTECGFYIKGANHKISNTKAHTNGIGDKTTIEYGRAPESAYEETSDTTKNPNKNYFTRSGAGLPDEPYVFTLYTGSEFIPGTTYYEMNKPYYKRYPGFYLEITRSILSNIESQENCGDGIYLYGPSNVIDCLLDANGRLVDNTYFEPLTYASQGIEPYYDGMYVNYYTPNQIKASINDFTYSTYGLKQRYGIECNRGVVNSLINAICTTNSCMYNFKRIGSRGANALININGGQEEMILDQSLLNVNSDYTIQNANTRPSTIKKYGKVVEISMYIKINEGNIPTGQSSDTLLFTLPQGFIPSAKASLIGILTSSAGYAHSGYCAVNIQTNGQVVFRNTGSSTGQSIIIRGQYEV